MYYEKGTSVLFPPIDKVVQVYACRISQIFASCPKCKNKKIQKSLKYANNSITTCSPEFVSICIDTASVNPSKESKLAEEYNEKKFKSKNNFKRNVRHYSSNHAHNEFAHKATYTKTTSLGLKEKRHKKSNVRSYRKNKGTQIICECERQDDINTYIGKQTINEEEENEPEEILKTDAFTTIDSDVSLNSTKEYDSIVSEDQNNGTSKSFKWFDSNDDKAKKGTFVTSPLYHNSQKAKYPCTKSICSKISEIPTKQNLCKCTAKMQSVLPLDKCSDKICLVKQRTFNNENASRLRNRMSNIYRKCSKSMVRKQCCVKDHVQQHIAVRNEQEQTSDPLFEIKVDNVDMCVLNPSETKDNVINLGEEKIRTECVCPSHAAKEKYILKKELCLNGACYKAFKNKKTDFTCKCLRNKVWTCTDSICKNKTVTDLNDTCCHNMPLLQDKNKPLFEVKVDPKTMCIINTDDIRKQLDEIEWLSRKLCRTGICKEKSKERNTRIRCRCNKNFQPDECREGACVKNLQKCCNCRMVRGNIDIKDIASKISNFCSRLISKSESWIMENRRPRNRCPNKCPDTEAPSGQFFENFLNSKSDKGSIPRNFHKRKSLEISLSKCHSYRHNKCIRNYELGDNNKELDNNNCYICHKPNNQQNNHRNSSSKHCCTLHRFSESKPILSKKISADTDKTLCCVRDKNKKIKKEMKKKPYTDCACAETLQNRKQIKKKYPRTTTITGCRKCCQCGFTYNTNMIKTIPNRNTLSDETHNAEKAMDKNEKTKIDSKRHKNSKQKKYIKKRSIRTYDVRCECRRIVRKEHLQQEKQKRNEQEVWTKKVLKNRKRAEKERKKMTKMQKKKRKKQKAEEKEVLKTLERQDGGGKQRNCCLVLLGEIISVVYKAFIGALYVLYRSIFHPKKSYRYAKRRYEDINGTFILVKRALGKIWRIRKLKVTKCFQNSETANILTDTFKESTAYQVFADRGKTRKEQDKFKSEEKKRKRRIRKRKEDAIFGCTHMLLTTLRKTPCLWVYHICPNIYPQLLGCLSYTRSFWHMCMFVLALACWTPGIILCELVRGLCCCLLCTA